MGWAEDMGYDSGDFESSKYWVTKTGNFLKPSEMSKSHRLATIAMVARNDFGGNQEAAIASLPILKKMQKLNVKGEK